MTTSVEYEEGPGSSKLSFRGPLMLRDAGDVWTDVRRYTAHLRRGARVDFDMSGAEQVDGGMMALLVRHRADLYARGVRAEFVRASEDVQTLVHLYAGDVPVVRRRRRRRAPEGLVEQIGRATWDFGAELKGLLHFIGEVALSVPRLIREPRSGNFRDVAPTLERTGANAVPIVGLINFLVGFVLAYQSAGQLSKFGANLYVADLVGKSVTREMTPLMTAIVLCGRSGAAFAAEIGTMQVGEEIDALRTMGFAPVRYLVLPRTLALMIALPVLTFLGDLAAVVGGMIVAVTSLGLTMTGYLNELLKVLTLWDVTSGLIKGVVFALAIALISCQQGFATSGGAEGVGRRTTASVVSILVALILIDAGFAVLFHAYDL
jgi:phospholipid/cholesterol/gamma-HCH transport system permease protein